MCFSQTFCGLRGGHDADHGGPACAAHPGSLRQTGRDQSVVAAEGRLSRRGDPPGLESRNMAEERVGMRKGRSRGRAGWGPGRRGRLSRRWAPPQMCIPGASLASPWSCPGWERQCYGNYLGVRLARCCPGRERRQPGEGNENERG